MNREEFWKLVDEIGWGTKTTDYSAISKRLRKTLTCEQALSLSDHVDAACTELARAINPYFDEKGEWFGGDSQSDFLHHVVGLGQKEWQKCIDKPKRAHKRFCKGDYKESFAYAIPYKDDYEKQGNLSAFFDWIDGQREIYEGGRLDGYPAAPFDRILTALSLLRDGDIIGFLATEESICDDARAIAREAEQRIRKLGGWCIDGSSVANEHGIINLYRDVKDYLI
jgi:hypothetical protein